MVEREALEMLCIVYSIPGVRIPLSPPIFYGSTLPVALVLNFVIKMKESNSYPILPESLFQ